MCKCKQWHQAVSRHFSRHVTYQTRLPVELDSGFVAALLGVLGVVKESDAFLPEKNADRKRIALMAQGTTRREDCDVAYRAFGFFLDTRFLGAFLESERKRCMISA